MNCCVSLFFLISSHNSNIFGPWTGGRTKRDIGRGHLGLGGKLLWAFFSYQLSFILFIHTVQIFNSLCSQTMATSPLWRRRTSATSWSKATWRRNEKVQQPVLKLQSSGMYTFCILIETFMFFKIWFHVLRPQLLWLWVAEEMVRPEQLHILLLWERKRFCMNMQKHCSYFKWLL